MKVSFISVQPYQPPAYVQPAEAEPQLQTTTTSPTRSKSRAISVPEAEKDKSKNNEEVCIIDRRYVLAS